MYFYFIIFLLGLIIGSFLNVLILRYGKEKTAHDGRSECMTCKKQLYWYELFPLVSWIVQGGKCRGCKTKVSVQYPLVEFTTGLMFVFVFQNMIGMDGVGNIGFNLETGVLGFSIVSLLVAFATLIIIFVYDLYHQIIPDEWSLVFAVSSLMFSITHYSFPESLMSSIFWWNIAAGPILFLPFYALWKYSDGKWIGLGDGKLAVGIGCLLGLSLGLSAIVYSFWLGAILACILLAVQKIAKKHDITMKTEIPFGPFMIIATLVTFITEVPTLTFVDYITDLLF